MTSSAPSTLPAPALRVECLELTRRPVDDLAPYRFRYVEVPDLSPEDQQHLEQSIRERGVLVPLDVLKDGRVVDGRQRLAFAQEAGFRDVPVRSCRFSDPLAVEWYALRTALVRRQLTAAQKLALAEPLLRTEAEAARQRQLAGLRQFRGGQDPGPDGSRSRGRTIERVARMLGVKPRRLAQFSTVVRHGPPEIVESMRTGRLSVDAAYRKTKRAPEPAGPTRRQPRTRRRARVAATSRARPRMAATVPLAVQELRAQVKQWMDESGRWRADRQAPFRDAIHALAAHIQDLIGVLSYHAREPERGDLA